jgi:membrane-associated PAP2 superfamily phosphatase
MSESPHSPALPGTDPSWRNPLLVVATLALASTPIFWLTDLDLQAASLFYAASAPMQRWPQEFMPVWRFFYYGAPLFTGALTLGALLVLIIGFTRRALRSWRRPAAYVLLTLALGPGLLVNVVFKDNWGRPRPRQIEQFDGHMQYLPPLAMGQKDQGKSFPAGHASVGFSFFTLWFLWRSRWPRLARWALAGAIALGTVMGLGRMAAGAHFLSDVLWSGYLTFLTALILHYLLLRTERRSAVAPANESLNLPVVAGYTLVGSAVAMGSLVSFPVEEQIDYRPAPEQPVPSRLHLNLGEAEVNLRLIRGAAEPLRVSGTVRGFGLPNHDIRSFGLYYGGDTPRFVYNFQQRGYFIEMDAQLDVEVDVARVKDLSINLQRGDIYIEADAPVPPLNLHLGNGEIHRPAASRG